MHFLTLNENTVCLQAEETRKPFELAISSPKCNSVYFSDFIKYGKIELKRSILCMKGFCDVTFRFIWKWNGTGEVLQDGLEIVLFCVGNVFLSLLFRFKIKGEYVVIKIMFVSVNFDHFQILRAIGKGSFGKVSRFFLLQTKRCLISNTVTKRKLFWLWASKLSFNFP